MSEKKVKTEVKKVAKPVKETKKAKASVKEEKPVKETKKTKVLVKEEKQVKETKKKATKETESVSEVKKTRVRKTTKESEVLLTSKDQKSLRIIARFVSIVAKIVKICSMIIVPILLTMMIMIPLMAKNIEINGNIIRFNDARFVLKDDNITLNIGDKNYLVADGIEDMDKVIEFFYNNSLAKITANVLLSMAFLVVIIITNIYILQNVEKLFDNFYRHKTPFEDENCNNIRRIARLMIAHLVITVVFNLILSLVFENDMTLQTTSYTIMEIIIVYACYFIFLYGTNLQKLKDTAIYDKEI